MKKQLNRIPFKKAGKYLLWITGIFFGLLVLTWVALLIYVNNNEQTLIRKISSLVEKRTKGEVQMKGLSVSFFTTFPLISLQLKDVVVRDSLYFVHHQDLLQASDIYLRASITGILMKKTPVGKVVIRNGSINLFTDSTGTTNEYVLNSGNGQSENKKPVNEQQVDRNFELPAIELRNVAVNLRNIKRKKHYEAVVRHLNCAGKKKQGRLVFDINMKMLVKHVAFNTNTGSYFRNIPVGGKFDLVYAVPSRQIQVNNIRLNLNGHPFTIDGFFNLDSNAADFRVSIVSNKVKYDEVTALLREPLEKKLKEYSISKPVDLKVNVSGKTSGNAQPLVVVNINAKNSKVGTPLGAFENCSFSGEFNNEMYKGKGTSDENSLIHLKDFSGKWEQILVKSKDIRISNLITPYLECDIVSDVDLKSLNSLAGSTSLQFLEGKSSINVFFKGPLIGKDSVGSTINGEIGIYNASVKYLPRNFVLNKLEGKLKFINNNLEVSKIVARAGTTELRMKGEAKNFLSMLDVSPEKLFLSWTITSPAIHLEDFKSFLSKTSAPKSTGKKAKFASTASKIDKLFAEGDMFINLRTPLMDYKTFRATDVEANVVLRTTEIAFEKVQLRHAGGSMLVSGSLENGRENNPVKLNAQLTNMDIPVLFAAFENFGQDAITHQNLSGKISANVQLRTAVNNDARLLSDANEGSISFLVEEGELNNFEPLQEISKKAFKKQDFSQIKFADLKNRLDVKGTTFIVHEMDIRSTALNLTVEGIYDFKKGTDMSIRLPVSNLTKSQAETDISDDGKAKKGVSLRLRARTGEDGKLKVSWDPFRRSKKNKEEVQDSTQANIPE